jgi:hypothetical protein
MSELTWADHPNADLRLRMAEYLGKGYKVVSLDETSARLSRPNRSTRPAWLLFNPLYLFGFPRKRVDEVLLTVTDFGLVQETHR